MRAWYLLIVFSLSAAPAAAAQLHCIDPNPATGSSAAVVVPDSAALLHTRQIFVKDIAELSHSLAMLHEVLAKDGVPKADVVKLNFALARDDLAPQVEQVLAKRFSGSHKPAVSFVSGRLPQADATIAYDVVLATPVTSSIKQVQIIPHFAVLPPGTRVWISGQAEKGSDLAEATRKTMEGLRASLKFVGLKDNAIVQLKAFVQPMAQAAVARQEMERFFDDQPVPPIVFLEWKSSLPIEIELIAWGGREREGLPLEFLTPPALKASPVFSRIARVNHGRLIYVSGLHATTADTPAVEVTEVFERLGGILKKAGSDYRHLAKATYYVTSPEAVKKMGELRPRYYDPKRPPAASLAMTEGTGRAGKSVTLDMIAVPSPTTDINEYGPPEYGYTLSEQKVRDGWISLFDGKTAFGWSGAKVEKGSLSGGMTTTLFGNCSIQVNLDEPGDLFDGDKRIPLQRGKYEIVQAPQKPVPLRLGAGASVRSIIVRPRKLEPLFNGRDLKGWKRIDHAKLPKERHPKWTIENGVLHAVSGPGALEYQGRPFGDMILQVEARMNGRHSNGGLFFRSVPGQFMNGYEAQLYNRCLDGDPGRPATWATGAIDDRQNARRLVSRDGEWLTMTVIAHGPHLATWVNGYQTVDWTDTRAKHDNPRQGLRLEPGTIQLQAHDAGTDITFRKVAAAARD
jgi:enamine deaminase RidA (YjgF/YER057c/UK114 family)